jgi:hypothetical protein
MEEQITITEVHFSSGTPYEEVRTTLDFLSKKKWKVKYSVVFVEDK